jgi:hypothetical protein
VERSQVNRGELQPSMSKHNFERERYQQITQRTSKLKLELTRSQHQQSYLTFEGVKEKPSSTDPILHSFKFLWTELWAAVDTTRRRMIVGGRHHIPITTSCRISVHVSLVCRRKFETEGTGGAS